MVIVIGWDLTFFVSRVNAYLSVIFTLDFDWMKVRKEVNTAATKNAGQDITFGFSSYNFIMKIDYSCIKMFTFLSFSTDVTSKYNKT